jgi:hypothetical protein
MLRESRVILAQEQAELVGQVLSIPACAPDSCSAGGSLATGTTPKVPWLYPLFAHHLCAQHQAPESLVCPKVYVLTIDPHRQARNSAHLLATEILPGCASISGDCHTARDN